MYKGNPGVRPAAVTQSHVPAIVAPEQRLRSLHSCGLQGQRSGIWAEVRPVETLVAPFLPISFTSGIWAEVRPVETLLETAIPYYAESGIWAEVRPVETFCARVARGTGGPEYGPKSGPLRLPVRHFVHGNTCPEYGPKSGPLRQHQWCHCACSCKSGIWAEVRPVETSRRGSSRLWP